MANYEFTYPSSRQANDIALDDLDRCLDAEHVEGAIRHAISLCVSEAFTNAVVHGNTESPTKKVLLTIEVNEREVIADITDQGSGGMRRISSKKPAAVQDEGGRGIDLIRHFADACYFKETESGALRVSIHFQRSDKKEYTT